MSSVSSKAKVRNLIALHKDAIRELSRMIPDVVRAEVAPQKKQDNDLLANYTVQIDKLTELKKRIIGGT